MRDASDAATSYAKDALDSDVYRDGTQAITDKVRENPLGSFVDCGRYRFCAGHADDASAAPSSEPFRLLIAYRG